MALPSRIKPGPERRNFDALELRLDDPGTGLSALDARLAIIEGFVVQRAVASGNLTLTTTAQDIPGATLDVDNDGDYLCWAVTSFQISTTGVGFCASAVYVEGVVEGEAMIYNTDGTGFGQPAQAYHLTGLSAGDTVNMKGSKFINAGVATARGNETTLTVRQVA